MKNLNRIANVIMICLVSLLLFVGCMSRMGDPPPSPLASTTKYRIRLLDAKAKPLREEVVEAEDANAAAVAIKP